MGILTKRFFYDKEISSEERFYPFIERKKIITFVPLNFLEKTSHGMSKAGAGVIGNYEMCSFRTEGTGTFKPSSKANPYSGNKNQLSYSEEIKLEMECHSDKLNKVIDALLKNHPYDEVAYEVYNFNKRDKKSAGFIYELKNKIKLLEFLTRMNQKIELSEVDLSYRFKKIAIAIAPVEIKLIQSAKFLQCECVLFISKKNYKFFIL